MQTYSLKILVLIVVIDYVYLQLFRRGKVTMYPARDCNSIDKHTPNWEEYKRMIDPTLVDQEGRTAMHLALLQGSDGPVLLEQMVDAGCDVNARDTNGQTPLHMAAERGYLASVKTLLTRNADVKLANTNGLTPTMLAARNGKPEVLKYLLDNGANVNETTNKDETTLHFAAAGNHLDCVNVILNVKDSSKLKINYTDRDRNTALIMASKKGNTRIIERLLQAGANPNVKDHLGQTALHWVAEAGDGDCALTLINKGADLDVVDSQTYTPFLKALRVNKPDVVKALISAGCDRSSMDGLNGTALALASLKGYKECVSLLLDAGDGPDEIGYFGMTPLMSAAFESRVEIAELLLQKGADPNGVGRSLSSALIKALIMVVPQNEVNRHKIVATLIRANADVSYRVTDPGYYTALTNGRNCPLSFAICSGYTSLIKMLLVGGSKVTQEEINEWFMCNKENDTGVFFQRGKLLAPIKEWKQQPLDLKHSCRLLIRQRLGKGIVEKIRDMPIAPGLKDFLNYREFDYVVPERAPFINGYNPGLRDYVDVTPCGLRAMEGTLLFSTVHGNL